MKATAVSWTQDELNDWGWRELELRTQALKGVTSDEQLVTVQTAIKARREAVGLSAGQVITIMADARNAHRASLSQK